MRYPSMADQRGFVWKKMMISVIGISERLNVKSKKLAVPNSDLA